MHWASAPAQNKHGLPASAAWLVACGLSGTASHLLLDFTNAYGVRPFLPFSGRWVAWDIMFIADPGVISLLAVGLGFPALLRLVSEEVGAGKPAYRTGAIFSLVALCLVWGLRDVAHRRAVAQLDSIQFGQENPRAIGAFPSPANPFSWTGVAETDSAFYVVALSALDDHVQTSDAQIFRKPEVSPQLEAAMKTSTARTFLDFARFPWGQVRELDGGYKVELSDLRFTMAGSARPGFVVRVNLDKELRVRSESFTFGAPRASEAGEQPSTD